MKFLLDMNLPPRWVQFLSDKGFDSVIQIRTQNVVPEAIGDLVLKAIARFKKELEQGALITIDPYRSRARVLPLQI